MKIRLATLALYVLRPFAILFYAVIKVLRPVRHKVTFISRQTDHVSPDFMALRTELTMQDRSLRVTVLCCSDTTRRHRFAGHFTQTLKELWHIAGSQAVVLDSYSPAISYFRQRHHLYVLQMWHALGAIKRFSWQALDTPGGRNSHLARALCMHAHYTALLTGGEGSRIIFSHAFRVSRARIHAIPLPRVGILRNPDPNRLDHLLAAHPQLLARRPLILYVPTFRDTPEAQQYAAEKMRELAQAAQQHGATLVVKAHPRDDQSEKQGSAPTANEPAPDSVGPTPEIFFSDLDTLDLLTLADHVITDYSAVCFEAAVAAKPLWFYLFDIDDYRSTRGLNIDPREELPQACFSDATVLIDELLRRPLPSSAQAGFLARYVHLPAAPTVATEKQIARLIFEAIQ